MGEVGVTSYTETILRPSKVHRNRGLNLSINELIYRLTILKNQGYKNKRHKIKQHSGEIGCGFINFLKRFSPPAKFIKTVEQT